MGVQGLLQASSLTGEPKTLTAFCASCPEPEEVEKALQNLGFHLSFSLAADEDDASTNGNLPPLPTQYHFEDEVGTYVIYLAGVDVPCLADDEDVPEAHTTYRYPLHASRFWLTPGGHVLVAFRVRDTLADLWTLNWQELGENQPVQKAA